MKSNNLVPVTFVDPTLLETGNNMRRALFCARNCDALATLLERVPDERHNQRVFTTKHGCRTVACAMGWAALSHVIPGLQYTHYLHNHYVPTINGKRTDWLLAAAAFFGDYVTDMVFMNTTADKIDTIDSLREHARTLRKKYLPDYEPL